jgi:hypothetical protein
LNDFLNTNKTNKQTHTEFAEAIPELDVKERLQKNLDIVLNDFLDKEGGYFHENVPVNKNEIFDCYETR